MKQRRPGQIKIFYAPYYSRHENNWSMICRLCLRHRLAGTWEHAMYMANRHINNPHECIEWKADD